MRVKEPYTVSEDVFIEDNRIITSKYICTENGDRLTLISRVTKPIKPMVTDKQKLVFVGWMCFVAVMPYVLLVMFYLLAIKKGL